MSIQSPSSRLQAHLSMLGATMLFGINYWVAKGLMPQYLQPMQIIFMRVAGALVLFWALEQGFASKSKKIERADFRRLAVAAMLGITMNQILFFTGLNLTTPVDSAIINSTNPLLVLAFSAVFLSQPIRPDKIAGIVLGACGALLLVVYGQKTISGGGTVTGNLFILANTVCWSLYLVIAKPLMEKYHPFKVMRWIFLFGFLFALPFTLRTLHSVNISAFTGYTWAAIFYVIIGTTFLAYLFITYGLRRLSPPVVAYYTYLQPAIVAGIGISLFNETLTLVKVLAALLIFGGIYLVNKRA